MSTTRNRRLRQLALERDEGRCRKCGNFDAKAQVDHVVDLQFGGRDELSNLETLCRRCHTPKTAAAATKRAKADRLAGRHQQTLNRRRVGPKVTAAFLLGLVIGATGIGGAAHAATPHVTPARKPCRADQKNTPHGNVLWWHDCYAEEIAAAILIADGGTP